MRRSILRGEADEIFRQTEENMRMTMRSMMRGLVGKHRQGIC